MGICSHGCLRKEGTDYGHFNMCFDWEVPHLQRESIMFPESQKSSVRIISVNIAAIAIAVNPSILMKCLGPDKILKINLMTKSLSL